ncbi:MAG TPA: ATP-binding protein [Micropepsaceae bacterium]|nr:ATP-binding protein [Micropepsaceae bacterium]
MAKAPDPARAQDPRVSEAAESERRHARNLGLMAAAGIVTAIAIGIATAAPLAAGLSGALAILLALGLVLRYGEQAPAGLGRAAISDMGRPDPFVVLSALPDPVFVVNAARRVVFVSRAVEGLIGAEGGKPLSVAVREPALRGAIESVFATGQPQTLEITVPVPVERQYALHVGPVMAEAGAFHVIAEIRDMTAQRALERMRADFVANASHELRTPLASLSGFIETLAGHAKDDPEAREKFLGIMQTQAQRMRRLIDDLLSLSRVELNEHIPPDAVCDLHALAEEVIATLSPLLTQARIRIVREMAEGAVNVRGEAGELAQVIQNLIDNAIRYGGEGKAITIRLRTIDGLAALTVADEGPGIAREHLPRLTERFYRVNDKESRDKGGTGLGLAIVKHILNRHRGQLAIESRPGAGASFTVQLPLVP